MSVTTTSRPSRDYFSPAPALAYLERVAAGTTKAAGLKRPTVAAVKQAALAIGSRAITIDNAGSYGWQVWFPGARVAAASTLAQVAAVLLRDHENAERARLAKAPAPAPSACVERMGFTALNPATEGWSEPLPADCYPPAARVVRSQQQQQPQQAPAVAPGPAARATAPARIPADVAGLLKRFGLTLDGLLTEGLSNAKLAKGAAVAWPVILHHLPAKALAAAVGGPEGGATATRSRIPGLWELAQRENVLALAMAHNGCLWASKGCAAGCLNWAGHGGMSITVAASRARRTMAMLADPAAYARAIVWAIARAWQRAQRQGLPLAARLRGTDDHSWHLERFSITPAEAATLARRYGLPIAPGVGITIPEAFSLAPAGSLHFYEYSKAPVTGPFGLIAQRSAGFDTTASLAADRPHGVLEAIRAVQAGFRLAVPVAIPKGHALPAVLILERGPLAVDMACVDGDATDHRWQDPQGAHQGCDGVAVILRTKRSRGRGPEADAFSLAPIFDEWQPLAGGGRAMLRSKPWGL